MISKAHLDFIPKIYDTIINARAWSDVLDEFAYHCGAGGSTLMMADNHYEKISQRVNSDTFDAHHMEEYDRLFGEEEAKALSVIYSRPVQTWLRDYEAFGMPAEQIPGNQFTVKHFGVNSRSAARLNDTPIWFDAMSINFKNGRGNITPEEEATSKIFLPHIAKAVELSRPFLLLQHRFNAILSALDRFRVGLVIVNAEGSIVVANREATAAFSAENGLSQSREKKFILRSENLQTRLTAAITAATGENANTVLAIPKRDVGNPWLLEVFPLAELHGEIDGAFQGAAIFITDPDRKDVISTEGMAQLFSLTDAEASVCKHLASGMKTDDIADHRNTSYETVKSQIKSLYSKTHTSSQSDLVRLALKVNLPVERPEG